MIFTIDDILTSGGRYTDRAKHASKTHRENAEELCDRLNVLFGILAISKKPIISSGFRLKNGEGARLSAHKEGKAIDFIDPDHAIAHSITRNLLIQCRLRREDTDFTIKTDINGNVVKWCHLDTRQPHGSVFKP